MRFGWLQPLSVSVGTVALEVQQVTHSYASVVRRPLTFFFDQCSTYSQMVTPRCQALF